MAKKQLFFAEAERLYVIEQQSLAEIESRLKISSRTLQDWKSEGDWELKRKNYLRTQSSTREEMFMMLNKLVVNTNADLAAGREVSSGRLYTIVKLAPILAKLQAHYDGTTVPEEAEDEGQPNAALTDEAKAKIREYFGL